MPDGYGDVVSEFMSEQESALHQKQLIAEQRVREQSESRRKAADDELKRTQV